MRYRGTLFQDLQSMVDACLQWNTRICANCQQYYGIHSEFGAYCPNPVSEGTGYRQTTFSELQCEAKTEPVSNTVLADPVHY